jgi:hypothetical protein
MTIFIMQFSRLSGRRAPEDEEAIGKAASREPPRARILSERVEVDIIETVVYDGEGRLNT